MKIDDNALDWVWGHVKRKYVPGLKAKNPKSKRNRKLVRLAKRTLKMKSGCVDCGTRKGRLEWDHVRGVKEYDIHAITSWYRLRDELVKCEVRCAECHLARHRKEGW